MRLATRHLPQRRADQSCRYFESFPIVYLEGYGFFAGNANLPFLALLVGSLLSYAGYCLWNRYVSMRTPVVALSRARLSLTERRFYFEEKFTQTGGKIKPEARLPMSFIAAFCFPVSPALQHAPTLHKADVEQICLFWFAWTANRTHWISPIIASSFFGLGATWM